MDRIDSISENGYIRFFDVATGDTVDVLTGGPKIIQNFWSPEEKYTDSAVNSSTSVIADGVCTITLGGSDNDDHEFTSGLIFDPSKGLTAEGLLALGDVDQTAFNFGFSDAITEAADKIAAEYSGTSLDTNATDCALLLSDADATTDRVQAIAVNTGTDGTLITASTAALVDDAYHRYRVEIDPAGNCKFYYDNVLAGTQALGVATTATLCAYFALISHPSGGAGADTAALKYMHAWQWYA